MDASWQAMVNRLAEQSRKDRSGRRHEFCGRVLWIVVVSSAIALLVGMFLENVGWL